MAKGYKVVEVYVSKERRSAIRGELVYRKDEATTAPERKPIFVFTTATDAESFRLHISNEQDKHEIWEVDYTPEDDQVAFDFVDYYLHPQDLRHALPRGTAFASSVILRTLLD